MKNNSLYLVLIILFLGYTVNASAIEVSGVTIKKVRVWNSGQIYFSLDADAVTAAKLNPGECSNHGEYWYLKVDNDSIQESRMYSLALAAKTAGLPVSVAVAHVCTSSNYPQIEMLMLE